MFVQCEFSAVANKQKGRAQEVNVAMLLLIRLIITEREAMLVRFEDKIRCMATPKRTSMTRYETVALAVGKWRCHEEGRPFGKRRHGMS